MFYLYPFFVDTQTLISQTVEQRPVKLYIRGMVPCRYRKTDSDIAPIPSLMLQGSKSAKFVISFRHQLL